MEQAARAGDLARMKYLRMKGHAWEDAHHVAALSGNNHILLWMYEEAVVVREREDTLPKLMRLVFTEQDECYRDQLALCMKTILDKRQIQSEIIKCSSHDRLEHPNAIPIKNRM